MCFIVGFRYRKPLIAKKDIVCYKVMLKPNGKFKFDYISFIRKVTYNMGNTYKTSFAIKLEEKKPGFAINKGIHSYNKQAGLYYFSRHKADFHFDSQVVLIKCCIPKGATYFKNRSDYVSNQLRLIEELKQSK